MRDDSVAKSFAKKWAEHVYGSAKRRFDRGDRSAILDALFHGLCDTNEPLPEWAINAFRDAYQAARAEMRHASWDDVFGRPCNLKKNAKREAARRERELLGRVWVAVTDARAANPRKDVFADVAKSFAISKALARKLFYAASALEKRNPDIAGLSMSEECAIRSSTNFLNK